MKIGTVSVAFRKNFGYRDIADSPRDKNGSQKLTCLTDYSVAGTTAWYQNEKHHLFTYLLYYFFVATPDLLSLQELSCIAVPPGVGLMLILGGTIPPHEVATPDLLSLQELSCIAVPPDADIGGNRVGVGAFSQGRYDMRHEMLTQRPFFAMTPIQKRAR